MIFIDLQQIEPKLRASFHDALRRKLACPNTLDSGLLNHLWATFLFMPGYPVPDAEIDRILVSVGGTIAPLTRESHRMLVTLALQRVISHHDRHQSAFVPHDDLAEHNTTRYIHRLSIELSSAGALMAPLLNNKHGCYALPFAAHLITFDLDAIRALEDARINTRIDRLLGILSPRPGEAVAADR